MKKFNLSLLFYLVILLTFRVYADTECGEAPINKDSSITNTVRMEANKLNVDSGDITSTIVQSYSDQFNKYKDADKVLASTYYQYQICILIMNSSLSVSEKTERLRNALNVITDMNKEQYQVVLSPGIDSFIQPSVKTADLYYRWRIKYRIDTKYNKNTFLINDVNNDSNIPDKEFEISKGNYVIKMEYDIGFENENISDIDGTCAIPFKVDDNVVLHPVISIQFNSFQGQNLIVKCNLNKD